MCDCTSGGLAIYAGGVLRDAQISVVRIFQFGAVGFLVSIVLLMCLKTNRAIQTK